VRKLQSGAITARAENDMLYALVIYEKPTDFARRDPSVEGDAYIAAWRTYHRALLDAGIYVGGNALEAPETATTVRLRDNKRQIQDGPYASTKELLGGFVVLELPSLDAALEWAARCPAASYGAVELRPLASDIDQRVTVDNTN
jgi:hypothetical protein